MNGKPIAGILPGSYLALRRKWASDDRIEVELDMRLHVWAGDQECRRLASIYRGPILLAYDHRYNLENAPHTFVRGGHHFDGRDCQMQIPELDADRLECTAVDWKDWLPPHLLLEFTAADGRPVRLCDFGSAGEAGTPYASWLPLTGVPSAEFSRANPLRSAQIGPA